MVYRVRTARTRCQTCASAGPPDAILAQGQAPRQKLDAEALLGLAACLIAGAALRVTHLMVLSDLPTFDRPDVDAAIYDALAHRVASGDWLLGREGMRLSPLYPYFLGGIYAAVDDGPWAFRWVQAGLGLAVVWLVWDCTRRLLGARWALVPAALSACYGPCLFFEGVWLATSLAVFVHALLVWYSVYFLTSRRVGGPALVGLGALWGITCLVRPNALLLAAPVFGVAIQLRRMRKPGTPGVAWTFGLVLLGASLAIAPVTFRNFRVTSEPVLLTTHGGFNLYIGNGPHASGTYRVIPEAQAQGPGDAFDVMKNAAEQAQGRSLTDREVDRFWLMRTLQSILVAPLDWIELMAKKLWLFWNGRELSSNYDYEFQRKVDAVLGLPLPQFAWIAPFALLGSLVMFWRRGPAAMVSLYAWAWCVSVVLVFVVGRYRLPFVAPALIAASYALRHLFSAAVTRNPRGLIASVLVLAIGIAASVPVDANKHFDQEYFKLAADYHELRRLPEAEHAYLQALDYNPSHLHARHNLAQLYEAVGAAAQARAQWEALHTAAQRAGAAALMGRAARHLDRLGPAPRP